MLVNDREISRYTIAVARKLPQQIRNTQQWSNWEAVFSRQSVRNNGITVGSGVFYAIRAEAI
jgi:hypothetical protein